MSMVTSLLIRGLWKTIKMFYIMFIIDINIEMCSEGVIKREDKLLLRS